MYRGAPALVLVLLESFKKMSSSHQLKKLSAGPEVLKKTSALPKQFLRDLNVAINAQQCVLPSQVHNADLTGLARSYEHRKSFDFNLADLPGSGLVFSELIKFAKQNAPKLWSNDFSGAWAVGHSQGLRYIEGGSFIAHADDRVRVRLGDGSFGYAINRPERQIVAIFYLNSCGQDYQGGELYFPNIKDEAGQPLQFAPQAGEMLLFGGDDRYLHGVREVTQGERHCITLWFAPLPIEPAQTVADVQAAHAAKTNLTKESHV